MRNKRCPVAVKSAILDLQELRISNKDADDGGEVHSFDILGWNDSLTIGLRAGYFYVSNLADFKKHLSKLERSFINS